MNILNYSAGADTGGQSIRFHQAFTKLTDHKYRSLVRSRNYLAYPRDLPWEARGAAINAAELIHANNTLRSLEHIQKPKILHYHGSAFRNNPLGYMAKAKQYRARQFVSTLDLYLIDPTRLEWLPAPYDLDWLASFRKPTPGPLRIGHAPTDRAVKSTDAFLKAVTKLKKTTKVQLVLIERMPWVKCLELKGTVDIFYDQVTLGYGNNAVEAWGMGIPVVCGGQPDTLAEMRNRFGGTLPFYEATEATIYDALKELSDEKTRKEFGEIGYQHADRFHSDRAVVDLMEPIYAKVIGSHPPIRQRPRRRGQRGPARVAR